VTYQGNAGERGYDPFNYTISDPYGKTASAAINMFNYTAMTAYGDSITVTAGHAYTFDPRTNDVQADGDSFTVQSVGTASHGTATVNSGGASVTYTAYASDPQEGDSFTYTDVDAHGFTGSATVSVLIYAAPVATADSVGATTASPATYDPRTNDTGVAITVTGVTQPAHGSVSIGSGGTSVTYTSVAGYTGTDSFTYTITDMDGATATATDTVTVAAANRPPVAVNDSVEADGLLHNYNPTVIFDPRTNDSDPDNDPLTITAVTQGSRGSVSFTSTSVTYTENACNNLGDSFNYTISDGHGHTASATVSVTNYCDPGT
jgi:hypothetical protein